MQFTAAKCTQCGANLQVDSIKEAAVCNHCGSAFVVQKAINNYNQHIQADVVNIYGADNAYKEEYVVRAGTLERYNGKSLDIVIPEGVRAIADECFENTQITSVVFPEGLRIIGKEAFRCCRNLTTIVLPVGLVKIGDYAFANCTNLQQPIMIPKTVTDIGAGAFYDCEKYASEIIDSIDYSTEHDAHATIHGDNGYKYKKGEKENRTIAIVMGVIFLLYLIFRFST